MTDKVFLEKISQVDTLNSSLKFGDAVVLLDELRLVLLPNDLAAYLSIKSILEDIKNDKNQDFIRKDIDETKKKILNQRLPKTEKISNFIISIVSYTLIPIVPFIANYLNNEPNTNKDIVLSLAMYCISIALSLKTARDRIFGILFSIIIFLLVDKEPKPNAVYGTYVFTAITVTFHLLDRINRHLRENEPFV
jgi:hypothetical protein